MRYKNKIEPNKPLPKVYWIEIGISIAVSILDFNGIQNWNQFGILLMRTPNVMILKPFMYRPDNGTGMVQGIPLHTCPANMELFPELVPTPKIILHTQTAPVLFTQLLLFLSNLKFFKFFILFLIRQSAIFKLEFWFYLHVNTSISPNNLQKVHRIRGVPKGLSDT